MTEHNNSLRQRDVWYCCYGSNLHADRFMKYIFGGKPTERSLVVHSGCRDRTEPKRNRPYTCHLTELCFAGNSNFWDGGGTCFIRSILENNATSTAAAAASAVADQVETMTTPKKQPVLMRKYLVTAEQFLDVVFQENCIDDVDLQRQLEQRFEHLLHEVEELKNQREIPFIEGSLYGQIVFLGHADGAPIFSFTTGMAIVPKKNQECENDATIAVNPPCTAYLSTIASGLVGTGHFKTLEETIHYFERIQHGFRSHGLTKSDIRKMIGLLNTEKEEEDQHPESPTPTQ